MEGKLCMCELYGTGSGQTLAKEFNDHGVEFLGHQTNNPVSMENSTP